MKELELKECTPEQADWFHDLDDLLSRFGAATGLPLNGRKILSRSGGKSYWVTIEESS